MGTFRERKEEIHLGDLIRALGRLEWQSAEQAQAIAGCLGFGLAERQREQEAARPSTRIFDRSHLSQQADGALPKRPPHFKAPPLTQPPPQVDLPAQVLPAKLNLLAPQTASDAGGAAGQRPNWLTGKYQRLDDASGGSPPRRTLLPTGTARGVLTAALKTWRLGSELDLDELVRRVVRGQLPPRLPRRPSMTLGRGCQLLLDFSDSMLPWWEDLHDLSRQVTAVLGEDRVSVFDFDSSPGLARQWQAGKKEAQAWQPEAGRPVVVATDFGLQGNAARRRSSADWRAFIERCAAPGCALIVLIPWSPPFWPTDLGPLVELVHWHPATSATMIGRQLGLAQRRAR